MIEEQTSALMENLCAAAFFRHQPKPMLLKKQTSGPLPLPSSLPPSIYCGVFPLVFSSDTLNLSHLPSQLGKPSSRPLAGFCSLTACNRVLALCPVFTLHECQQLATSQIYFCVNKLVLVVRQAQPALVSLQIWGAGVISSSSLN